MVRRIGTNKTQIPHRIRLRQFTPRQPVPDIPITPREWQPHPEVVIKQDDLYARAWECEYVKPIFDSDYNNLVIPNSPEIRVRSEETADEMGALRKPYGRLPQKLSLRQTDRTTERTRITTCSLMRILA